MRNIVLFAFNGEMMCFIHVLLNALDMHKADMNPKIVFEGAATTLVPQLAKPDNPFHQLYQKTKEAGLIEGACKACSSKLGVLDAVKAEGIPLLDEISGHPSIGAYMRQGFEVITF